MDSDYQLNPDNLQSEQEIVINAPIKKVWAYNLDLTNIPAYHPRVDKVDLISDQKSRGADVAYRCHLNDGKDTCIEKDVEVVPMQKIVTVLPEDTMGITDIFDDYVVVTRFTSLNEDTTKMEFCHYYSTKTLKKRLLNLIAKWKIARQSQNTLSEIKKAVEQRHSN